MSWKDLEIEKINTIEKLVAEFEVSALTFFEEDMENGCCGMAELWYNTEAEYQEAMERRKTEYGSSDNWHDVAKAWPDPDRYEYTGREIKIVDNT